MGRSSSTIYRRLAAAGIARRPARRALSRQDLIAGLERGWSAPELAAAHAVSVSCVCRALDRERLVTAAQALKQQMRLRYAEYYASPVHRLPTSASAATPDPEALPLSLTIGATLCVLHEGCGAHVHDRVQRSRAHLD
jgi:hypothetical protein